MYFVYTIEYTSFCFFTLYEKSFRFLKISPFHTYEISTSLGILVCKTLDLETMIMLYLINVYDMISYTCTYVSYMYSYILIIIHTFFLFTYPIYWHRDSDILRDSEIFPFARFVARGETSLLVLYIRAFQPRVHMFSPKSEPENRIACT